MSNITVSSTDISIAYASTISLALIPIYVGSHLSLYFKFHVDNSDIEEEQILTSKDAMYFPIYASGFLFGLYMIFKVFSKEYVNLLLTSYISIAGIYSIIETLKPYLVKVLPHLDVDPRKLNIDIPVVNFKKEFNLTHLDYINFFISCCILIWYLWTKHWVANNLVAYCFAIQAIARIKIGNYKAVCTLLSGLFFYDIFWVFATEVMVTVARSFDAPIKLMIPKALFAKEYSFSMLGLGDIVLPGVFIAFLLRYDSFRVFGNEKPTKAFPKTFFSVCFISYFIGLVATILVMHTFQAAQPALLYLSPACILSSLLTAVVYKNVNQLFSFKDSIEKPKKEEENPPENNKEKPPENNKETPPENKEKHEDNQGTHKRKNSEEKDH